jgi:hypothetical protein
MERPSPHRLAQVGIGVLLLIIIRSLGEVFRLQQVQGEPVTIAQITPYVGSALVTAVVLAAALVCKAWGRDRIVIGGVIATVLLLLAYKIAVIG